MDSDVEVEVVVLSGCWFDAPPPKPATATESLPAVDLRFLASLSDSDLLKRPAVYSEWKNVFS